ncbi:MAG: glycosyl transferase family 2 [Firmicutes bacterium]|nr:glycosyl transferase family 2 [Bacillota bacterium]
MKVSLCMIAKNEGKNLRRCLQSVIGVVDEMIVVDTGSTDNTCEIANEFGAKVERFAWNGSFSDARNRSIDLAKGDWILFLDADEELTPESGVLLPPLLERKGVSGYFLRIENYVGGNGVTEMAPDIVFRLFRNKPEHRFHGAIHEQIADVILQHNKETQFVVAEDLVIRHYGFLDQQLIEKDKKNRNLRMVEEHIGETPDDKMLRFHYGVELYRVERYEQAANEFIKAAEGIDVNTGYLPKLMRYVTQCYYNQKKYELALNIIKQGLAWFPTYADLHYFQGLIYYEQGEYGLAYMAFGKAVAVPKQPSHFATINGVNGFRAYYFLGQIAEMFCNEEEALRNYVMSLRDNAACTAALECICRILEPRVDEAYAKQALGKICEFKGVGANKCIAEFLMNQSAYNLAYEFFDLAHQAAEEEAGMKLEEASDIKVKKAICLMQKREFAEAMSKFESITAEDPFFLPAMFNRLLAFWLQGRQQGLRKLAEDITALKLTEDSANVVKILVDNMGERSLPKVTLGKEGIVILLDVFKRSVVLGEWERAITLLEGVTPETKKELNSVVGECCFKYGKLELAERFLDACITENNQCWLAYFILAQVKEKQGELLDAHYYYRQAMSLEPKNPKNYIHLARLYDKMHQDIVKQTVEKYQDVPVVHGGLKLASGLGN